MVLVLPYDHLGTVAKAWPDIPCAMIFRVSSRQLQHCFHSNHHHHHHSQSALALTMRIMELASSLSLSGFVVIDGVYINRYKHRKVQIQSLGNTSVHCQRSILSFLLHASKKHIQSAHVILQSFSLTKGLKFKTSLNKNHLALTLKRQPGTVYTGTYLIMQNIENVLKFNKRSTFESKILPLTSFIWRLYQSISTLLC